MDFFAMLQYSTGTLIQDDLEDGNSREPMNPCTEYMCRFIFSFVATRYKICWIVDSDLGHPKEMHPQKYKLLSD